jgi:hypothetical protein
MVHKNVSRIKWKKWITIIVLLLVWLFAIFNFFIADEFVFPLKTALGVILFIFVIALPILEIIVVFFEGFAKPAVFPSSPKFWAG